MLARAPSHLAVHGPGDLVQLLEPDTGDELGHEDVHGASHASAEVRRAASDQTQDGVAHEDRGVTSHLPESVLDRFHASREPLEDALDVPAFLHGDDAEMVALVDPEDELFGVAVEYATPMRPVDVVPRRSLHLVLAPEEEMVVHELLDFVRRHGSVEVELPGQISIERFEDFLHEPSDLLPRLLGAPGVEREEGQVTGHTDAGRDDLLFGLRREVDLDLRGVHISNVVHGPVCLVTNVIFLDHRVVQILVEVVGLKIASVAAYERRRVARASIDCPGNGPTGRFRLEIFVFLKDLGRHGLGHQGKLSAFVFVLREFLRPAIRGEIIVKDKVKVRIRVRAGSGLCNVGCFSGHVFSWRGWVCSWCCCWW